MKKNIIQRLVDKLYKLQKRIQDRALVKKVQNQQVAYESKAAKGTSSGFFD